MESRKKGSSSEFSTGRKSSAHPNRAGTVSGIMDTVAPLAISAVATYVTAKAIGWVSNKIKRSSEMKDNKNVTGPQDLPKKKTPSTPEEDVKNTNPKFKSYNEDNGYISNCMYCSTVYDLRQRGYDVTANKRTMGGNPKEITTWYKGAKLEKYKSQESAEKALLSQPEGARGNLCIMGQYGGHSVAYEKRNGKIIIRDGQTGESKSLNELVAGLNISTYHVVRTDNCEPNWSKIGEAIDPDSLKKGRE